MAPQQPILTSLIFSPRYKNVLHILQLLLSLSILVLGLTRLLTRPSSAPRTRTDTMALGMAGKSLAILSYQVLTEHIARLHRFASLKACFILNCIEIVTWGAVAFMGIQVNVKSCIGTRCALGWVVVVLAVLASILATYATAVSYLPFKSNESDKTEDQSSSSVYLSETTVFRD